MINKKIIFLSTQPIHQHNYERFGFETFIEKGWEVECWVSLGKLSSIIKDKEIFYKKRENFINIKSFFDFIKRIKKLPSNFYFVDFSSNSFLLNIVQRIMILKGGKRIALHLGTIPIPKYITKKIFLSKKKTTRLFLWFTIKMLKNIFSIVRTKLLNLKNNYILTAGDLSYEIQKKKSKKAKIINTHSFDYEKYMDLRNTPPNSKYENSVVYIDQNYEENYEFLLSGEQQPVTKDQHWDSINTFLDILSKKLNKKVLIAGHHRRDPKKKINTNYEVIFFQTANLIRNASLVVSHTSTCVGLAFLFKKPLVFITSNEIKKSTASHDLIITNFAKEIGAKPINIDEVENIDPYNLLNYDEKVYKGWIEKFIKSPDSKTKNLWHDFIYLLENEGLENTNFNK